MTIEEAIAALPKYCPVHNPDALAFERKAGFPETRRLGVEEGKIIFACGCRQSQRNGVVQTPNLLDHVITATEGAK